MWSAKALSKDPNDRYADHRWVCAGLECRHRRRAVGGTLRRSPRRCRPKPSTSPNMRPPNRHAAFARSGSIACAAGAVVDLGIGGVLIALREYYRRPIGPWRRSGWDRTFSFRRHTIVRDADQHRCDHSTPPSTPIAALRRCLPRRSTIPPAACRRGEQGDTRWGYVDGEYQLLISAANKMQTRLIGPALTDYDATVEARFAVRQTGQLRAGRRRRAARMIITR